MTTKLTTTNFSSSLLSLVSQPTVSAITVTDSSYTATGATAVDLSGGYIKITGNGFVSGSTVYIDSTPVTSVAFVNSTQLNCVVPAFASNSYVVYVVNIDGSVAIRVNGITYSSTPTWTSSSIQSSNPIVSIQLIASSDTAITYTLAAGSSLPSGLTLSSSGLLSGTVTGTVTVTYNFSVVATDVETQISTRAFSVTITFGDEYFKNITVLLNGETSVTPFIKDSSTNNFALTIAGDTKPVPFNPYQGDGYYSNYFDGTGDYLTFPNNSVFAFGTSAFTIEFWIYTPSVLNDKFFISGRGAIGTMHITSGGFGGTTAGSLRYVGSSTITSSSTLVTDGLWHHCAIVRDGSNNITLYVDGVSRGTGTDSTNYTTTSGTWYLNANDSGPTAGGDAYYSNLRIVKGTAVYTTTFTPPTTPLIAITNTSLLTCQSNRLIDKSTNNFTITNNGDTLISSAIPFTQNISYSTYGSTYFDGTGDNLTVPNSAFDLTSAIWSIEYWIYPTTIASTTYYGLWALSTSGFRQGIYGDSGTHYLSVLNAGGGYGGFNLVAANKVITLNNWQHIALTSDGTTIRQFYNGVQTSTGSVASFTPSTPTIGSWGASSYFAGYMSNFRIVIGSSTYTANFTPPTSLLTAVTNTRLLTLQYNGGANNSGIIDNSNFNNVITKNGNTSQGTFSPYSVIGWSVLMSTATLQGRAIQTPATLNNTSGANGDFTAECWAMKLGNSSLMTIAMISGTTQAFCRTNSDGSAGGLASWSTLQANHNTFAPIGTWFHVAACRHQGTLYTYINGQMVNSGANTTNYTFNGGSTSSQAQIGNYNNNTGQEWIGYISNYRIVNGTAIYPSGTTFTPSTSPLTAVPNTILLTLQDNRIVDNSQYGSTLVPVGTVTVQAHSPFGSRTKPVPISYSNYFDGNGDYLSIPDNTALDLATGGGSTAPFTGAPSFTIECWFYCTALTADFQNILNKDGTSGTAYTQYSFVISSAGLLKLVLGHGENASTGNGTEQSFTILNSITLNTWYHVAACQATPNQIYTFLNGTLIATTTRTQYMANGGGKPLLIGYQTGQPAGHYFNGFVSNVRIIKGTALYTTSFTPSTTPLTAISNTSLLTCQSTMLIDNSTNAFTITANGDVKPRIFNPFGYTTPLTSTSYTPSLHGGSAYFDGTGDYLTAPYNAFLFGSNDFTIECWVYPIASLASKPIVGIWRESAGTSSNSHWSLRAGATGTQINFYYYTSGGSAVFLNNGSTSGYTLNAWNHIAVVRKGSTLTIYLNGVSYQSAAISGSLNAPTVTNLGIAADYAGLGPQTMYMSDLRIINGAGIYTGNFLPPTQALTNYSTNIPSSLLLNFNNGGIIDQHSGVVLETVGNVQVSTSIKKYDNASVYFDGTGDYLSVANNTLFSLSSGKYTIECWAYWNSLSGEQVIVERFTATSGPGYTLYKTGSNTISIYGSATVVTSTTAVLISTWYHIAVTYDGTNTRIFINGALEATAAANITDGGTSLIIGSRTGGSAFFNGYIDDFRITKGHARYTGTFVPPAALLTTSS